MSSVFCCNCKKLCLHTHDVIGTVLHDCLIQCYFHSVIFINVSSQTEVLFVTRKENWKSVLADCYSLSVDF